ncbi:MAG: ATP-binding protein [Oscillospiraceae bacterium]|nr:ATP-binding protein [Oscillospiraceae bacterium]
MDIWTELARYRENGYVEAKEALGGLPESLWETYSAFANAEGGVILLGVGENPDHSFRILELLDPEELLEEFWAIVRDPEYVSVNLLKEEDVQILREEGKCIIAIFIPEAPPEEKPVHLLRDPWRHSYRRVGEADKRCSREEVEQMLKGRDA